MHISLDDEYDRDHLLGVRSTPTIMTSFNAKVVQVMARATRDLEGEVLVGIKGKLGGEERTYEWYLEGQVQDSKGSSGKLQLSGDGKEVLYDVSLGKKFPKAEERPDPNSGNVPKESADVRLDREERENFERAICPDTRERQ